jgi:hypothetical protein
MLTIRLRLRRPRSVSVSHAHDRIRSFAAYILMLQYSILGAALALGLRTRHYLLFTPRSWLLFTLVLLVRTFHSQKYFFSLVGWLSFPKQGHPLFILVLLGVASHRM